MYYSKRHYDRVQGYPGSKGNPDYRTPAERKADEIKIFRSELQRARDAGQDATAAALEAILRQYGAQI